MGTSTGYYSADGREILTGDIVTTWGSQTQYKVVMDENSIPVLEGVKPLSYVNCLPVIINR